ncbi:MAG TPA: DNA-processing protein DprA [Rhodocyclaceae bacterium]|jgi:DNA processing protein
MVADTGLASWLRLAAVPGIGSQTQRQLLSAFGLPEEVFAASGSSLRSVIGADLAIALHAHDSTAEIEAALAWADEPGNHLLTLADPDYPRALLDTQDPPILLYAKGSIEHLNRPAIALVGSRNATHQGEENAEAFAEVLSKAGLGIVSGMALGIDAAAHRGGLKGPGSTIAVIGTGIDRIYPARNAPLARQIAERGVILSEFALGMPPLQHNFPRRNRIIAGLAKGCLVVEAAERSGSLITARLAAEAGREVFAIPGSIHSPVAKGCHKLIKQGAKLVESAQDILEELCLDLPSNKKLSPAGVPENDEGENAVLPLEVNGNEGKILASMAFDPVSIDTLADRTGLTADILLAMLLPLELEGRVAQVPGGLYQQNVKGAAK